MNSVLWGKNRLLLWESFGPWKTLTDRSQMQVRVVRLRVCGRGLLARNMWVDYQGCSSSVQKRMITVVNQKWRDRSGTTFTMIICSHICLFQITDESCDDFDRKSKGSVFYPKSALLMTSLSIVYFFSSTPSCHDFSPNLITLICLHNWVTSLIYSPLLSLPG